MKIDEIPLTKEHAWSKNKTGFIYHCTPKSNLVKIYKDKCLKPTDENCPLYFSVDTFYDSNGSIVFKSKQKVDLGKFGCSAPPVVWTFSEIDLDEFEIFESVNGELKPYGIITITFGDREE